MTAREALEILWENDCKKDENAEKCIKAYNTLLTYIIKTDDKKK